MVSIDGAPPGIALLGQNRTHDETRTVPIRMRTSGGRHGPRGQRLLESHLGRGTACATVSGEGQANRPTCVETGQQLPTGAFGPLPIGSAPIKKFADLLGKPHTRGVGVTIDEALDAAKLSPAEPLTAIENVANARVETSRGVRRHGSHFQHTMTQDPLWRHSYLGRANSVTVSNDFDGVLGAGLDRLGDLDCPVEPVTIQTQHLAPELGSEGRGRHCQEVGESQPMLLRWVL